MSDSLFPPFLKWGHSKNKEKPDTVRIRVTELETFETQFTININAEIYQDKKWNEITIPLKSHESKNSSLLDQWTRGVNEGKIKAGDELIIKSYRDKSRNGREILRFSLAKALS